MAKVTKITVSEPGEDYLSDKKVKEKWQKQLEGSHKRLKDFIRQGNRVNQRFLSQQAGYGATDNTQGLNGGFGTDLNLFYTNITTLESMLYGSTPAVDVAREHADPDDDIARVAALLYQRMLQADVEPSGSDAPSAFRAALQDRLIPGLGVCRVRYEVETGQTADGNPEGILSERAPIDYVHWQDFRWGWSRTWAEVPWLAYRSFLTKEEATERFSEVKAEWLTYKEQTPTGSDDGEYGSVDERDNRSETDKAEIWEIWDKKTRTVCWYSKGADNILDKKDDPLQLDGFWPSPEPMMANVTTTLLVPKADYILAQDIYAEINLLASRITIITEAIKVVGVYAKDETDSVGRMLQEGTENTLIPVDNWAMFAEKGGLAGTIDWFPVQDIVGVLSVLRQELTGWIDLLYQQTGMSDVMRGANTDQYQSDGSNQLKAKMGSIRVQALQDRFALFASECEQLRSEVISKHFSIPQIILQANAEYLQEADRPLIMPALQLMKDPKVKWRIGIRPESIAISDYAQLRNERTEFLTAVSTYVQSASSAAQTMPGSTPLLLKLMQWGLQGFRGSDSIEGVLDQAVDQANKAAQEGGNEEPDAAQLAQQEAQAEMEKQNQKHQNDMELSQMKSQLESKKIMEDSQANIQEIMAKSQADSKKEMEGLQATLQTIMAKLDADVKVEEAQSTMAIAEKDVEHQYSMIEENQDHSNTIDQQNNQATNVRSENDE
jgi:hypothetical protein